MKTLYIITLTIVTGFILSTSAFASNEYDSYGAKVDQMISFYQARLYLMDSEYKTLSDIGADASLMINFLQERRNQLIEEMKEKRFYRSEKIRNYIVNKARAYVAGQEKINTGLEYSKF